MRFLIAKSLRLPDGRIVRFRTTRYTGGARRPLKDPDMDAVLGDTNKDIYWVEAMVRGKKGKRKNVGYLQLRDKADPQFPETFPRGFIEHVKTKKKYRRKGIATGMYKHAVKQGITPFHSSALSNKGKKWRDAVGGPGFPIDPADVEKSESGYGPFKDRKAWRDNELRMSEQYNEQWRRRHKRRQSIGKAGPMPMKFHKGLSKFKPPGMPPLRPTPMKPAVSRPSSMPTSKPSAMPMQRAAATRQTPGVKPTAPPAPRPMLKPTGMTGTQPPRKPIPASTPPIPAAQGPVRKGLPSIMRGMSPKELRIFANKNPHLRNKATAHYAGRTASAKLGRAVALDRYAGRLEDVSFDLAATGKTKHIAPAAGAHIKAQGYRGLASTDRAMAADAMNAGESVASYNKGPLPHTTGKGELKYWMKQLRTEEKRNARLHSRTRPELRRLEGRIGKADWRFGPATVSQEDQRYVAGGAGLTGSLAAGGAYAARKQPAIPFKQTPARTAATQRLLDLPVGTTVPMDLGTLRQFRRNPGVRIHDYRHTVDLARAMEGGAKLPPVTLRMINGKQPFIMDGMHRINAAHMIGLNEVPVRVESETRAPRFRFPRAYNRKSYKMQRTVPRRLTHEELRTGGMKISNSPINRWMRAHNKAKGSKPWNLKVKKIPFV